MPQLFVNERHVGGLENIKVSSLCCFCYQNLSNFKIASVFGQIIYSALAFRLRLQGFNCIRFVFSVVVTSI